MIFANQEYGCRTCGGKCDAERKARDRSFYYRREAYKWYKMGHKSLALSCMSTSVMLRRKLTIEFGWPSPIPQ